MFNRCWLSFFCKDNETVLVVLLSSDMRLARGLDIEVLELLTVTFLAEFFSASLSMISYHYCF